MVPKASQTPTCPFLFAASLKLHQVGWEAPLHIFNSSHRRRSIGLKSGLRLYLGPALRLETSEVQSPLEQLSHPRCVCSLLPSSLRPPWLVSQSLKKKKGIQSMMRPLPCLTVGMVLACLTRHHDTNTTPVLSSCLIGPAILFPAVRESIIWIILFPSSLCSMCLLLRSGFQPLYPTGLIDGLLHRWFSFWKFLCFPQRSSLALGERPSSSWSPLWPRVLLPLSPVRASSSKSPNFFHLRVSEAIKEIKILYHTMGCIETRLASVRSKYLAVRWLQGSY